jgi:GYF domain 2
MQSYSLKISDRAGGPYSEAQISQLYSDGRIDRHTPCRLATDGDWKTIDDFLPMLKYGTQLPVPTSAKSPAPGVTPEDHPPPPTPAPPLASPQRTSLPSESRRIALVDIDLPFVSILKLMFKWMAAAFLVLCCFIPALVFLLFIVMAIFGSLLGHMFSGFQNP